jgi:AraC family transcriptional regulator of adaptative response / methylphosphotriester-DNA alkyltransferase methyltransferase
MTPVDAADPRKSTASRRTELFEEATAILRSDFARPITLLEVAARIAASPRQVRRAFVEVGGTTFGAHLHDFRMARAAELLSFTDLPMRQVARRVGYRQPSQFTKAFKRAFGVTPSRYRLGKANGGEGPTSGMRGVGGGQSR